VPITTSHRSHAIGVGKAFHVGELRTMHCHRDILPHHPFDDFKDLDDMSIGICRNPSGSESSLVWKTCIGSFHNFNLARLCKVEIEVFSHKTYLLTHYGHGTE